MPTLQEATKLLLHFDGTWISSTFGRYLAVSPLNGATFGTPAKFGTNSAQFGSRDSSYVEAAHSDDWSLGTGPFTIDFWMRPTDVNGSEHTAFTNGISSNPKTLYCQRDGTAFRIFAWNDAGNGLNGMTWPGLLIGTIAANTWYHVAIVREEGGPLLTFLNGVLTNSFATAGQALYDTTYPLYVGGMYGYTHGFGGQIDEFRWVKGLAIWTADFSVPTQAYESYQSPLIASLISVEPTTGFLSRTPAIIGEHTGTGAVPTISNITPPAGTLLRSDTHISLDVTDADSAFRRIILTIKFDGADAPEVIYDGTDFSTAYLAGSTRTAIPNGLHFDLVREGGWPAAPTFTPFAIDVTGLENA